MIDARHGSLGFIIPVEWIADCHGETVNCSAAVDRALLSLVISVDWVGDFYGRTVNCPAVRPPYSAV